MADLSMLQPPSSFNFTKPEEWTKWKSRFQQYRLASGLSEKPGAHQTNTLLYCLGEEAEDVLDMTGIAEGDKTKYDTVMEYFDRHFKVRTNLTYERARFNRRKQQKGESVELFITDLHHLVKNCEYGTLKDQMIRDGLVIGIRDRTLSDRLQMEPDLTLEKAKKLIRQREAVKEQGAALKGQEESLLEEVHSRRARGGRRQFTNRKPPPQSQGGARRQSGRTCRRCGKDPHPVQHCPAKDATCFKCNRKGHFGRQCLSKTVAEVTSEMQGLSTGNDPSDDESLLDTAYLNTITGSMAAMWPATVKVNRQQVTFKVDTRAEVTAMSEATWKSLKEVPRLSDAQRKLCGPDHRPLQVLGKATVALALQGKSCTHTVYIVRGLRNDLLGFPAIKALELLPHIESIDSARIPSQYPDLFTGLGTLKRVEYTIRLKPDAQPSALHASRNVPLPLKEETEKELKRMEQLGVISKVSEPTEWCAGMVVVPKESGKVRICVDMKPLNESVLREFHPLPKVDTTLAQLAGAKLFSKIDANSGFWQIPLSPESRLLTTFITPWGRYCFNKLPFGIASAPEFFQRTMSEDYLEWLITLMTALSLVKLKRSITHDCMQCYGNYRAKD